MREYVRRRQETVEEINCATTNLRIFYRGGADAGVQSEPEVAGSGPRTGCMQRIQQRGRE